jgi:sugar lactone lactonase YvrE
MTAWRQVSARRDQLGESPFWHPDEQTLYWIDIPGRRLQRLLPDGQLDEWPMPTEPGCIAPVQGGGLMIALRDAVYRVRRWGDALALVLRFGHDAATTRFNDGKADPLGRFWAGTMYEPKGERRAELFSVDLRPDNGANGRPVVELKAHNALTANGLAWSPDRRTVYWSDTPEHVIHAWDWDAPSNAMRNHRFFRRFDSKPAGWQAGAGGYAGRPDGAAVDVEGNYWCAMYEGGRLMKLSPQGEVLAEIALPVMCPTMPCFGGPDLKTLYVTTASNGRPAEELAAMPMSGHVIATEVDVPGLPVNFVIA